MCVFFLWIIRINDKFSPLFSTRYKRALRKSQNKSLNYAHVGRNITPKTTKYFKYTKK